MASRWQVRFGVMGGVVALGLLPLAVREVQIHGPNAKISPSGKAVAELVDVGSLRIDRLPTGNVLAVPPHRFAAATITDFGWQADDTVWIRVKGTVRPDEIEERLAGVRLRVEADEAIASR